VDGIVVALLLVPVAYLLGTFPSAVMVARSRGVDIFAAGSGNPGASNVGRVLGAKWGALVFLLDALKGTIPALVGLAIDTRPGAYLLITAAVLGHMYPVTRRFRGGKGVATMGGAMLTLHPLISLCLLATWILVRKATGTASLASLLITIGLPIGIAIAGAPGWEIVYVVALCALVLVRHIDNIRRLLGRRELSAHHAGT
jgi:glycerol-3-phosphate acyltransferase PlsY